MSSIRALGVAFAYSDAAPLFADTDFLLPTGWTGLVGPNGAGKSTLLQLLSGALQPSAGRLQFEPEEALVHLCPQRVEALDPSVEALAWAWEPEAVRLRHELGLDPAALERWPRLSPGERKRWQVGSALARAPDVLLLDEPTNHLDAEARARLLRALRTFSGVGVIVSHDRALLEELSEQTLWLEAGELACFRGSYEAARVQREADAAQRLERLSRAQEAQRHLERRLAQARQQQQQATAQRRTGKRMRNRHDSDARSLAADFRVEQAQKGIGKQIGRIRWEAVRVGEAVDAVAIHKELGRSVFLHWQPAPKAVLLSLQQDLLLAGERPLLREINLRVGRSDRIHLAGPNGAGKSTLLAALLAAGKLPPEKILHLPQELSPQEGEALLDDLRRAPPDLRGRVLSLVAALGLDPARLLATHRPSPGEARKLWIASGMARHAWLLALDEPTNHLDLPAIERLEAALVAWPGALLLVSHDDALARRCTERRWRIEGGSVIEEPEPCVLGGKTTR